jgi:hypothetical protein
VRPTHIKKRFVSCDSGFEEKTLHRLECGALGQWGAGALPPGVSVAKLVEALGQHRVAIHSAPPTGSQLHLPCAGAAAGCESGCLHSLRMRPCPSQVWGVRVLGTSVDGFRGGVGVLGPAWPRGVGCWGDPRLPSSWGGRAERHARPRYAATRPAKLQEEGGQGSR